MAKIGYCRYYVAIHLYSFFFSRGVFVLFLKVNNYIFWTETLKLSPLWSEDPDVFGQMRVCVCKSVLLGIPLMPLYFCGKSIFKRSHSQPSQTSKASLHSLLGYVLHKKFTKNDNKSQVWPCFHFFFSWSFLGSLVSARFWRQTVMRGSMHFSNMFMAPLLPKSAP